ncbi:unnamed protein product [Kluyveromyces dobzhanskii CBS 2104]|uniref:WGS project CCBQ000000000 data, contig 00107 n=1 Tax=Kluyveromyces dobzhanskii CBS 2104 TaxID=1427455 RepID=A0A0A8L1J1_9SACH|nr:unnamed protein product [Kluyveromyces dobzhanskii CBS 2104]
MNLDIDTATDKGSLVLDLLRKPFNLPQRYADHLREEIEETELTTKNHLNRKRIFSLLKVLPIRLLESDVRRSDLFQSIKRYCKTERYNEYGADWPTELADSMGLDSLLDWDFDIEQTDNAESSTCYTPNQLLMITERTVSVMGFDTVLTTPSTIIDAIVVPNQTYTDRNDTCLLCLITGEVYSLDFCYSEEIEKYNIELTCTWKVSEKPANFDASFTYSRQNDVVGLAIPSVHIMCVLSLHKRERTFFKLQVNVLLQLGCDIETITWQCGNILYIDYHMNGHARVIEQDVQKYGFFDCNFIINDVTSGDRLILLDRDNVIQIDKDTREAVLVSGGGAKSEIGYLDLAFRSSAGIVDHHLLKVLDEPLKTFDFMIMKNSMISLTIVTDSNKVLVSEITRLPIPIDGLVLERVIHENELTVLILSRGEVIRYVVDLNELTFREATIYQLSKTPVVMLMQNVIDEEWITEGYEKIDCFYPFRDSIILHSKHKLYDIPSKTSDPCNSFDIISFLSELQAFQEVKIVNLKNAYEGNGLFGSIAIRNDDFTVQQYVLVGISSLCTAQSYYLELRKDELANFQLIDDLLPDSEDTFIEFAAIAGNFLSITENILYVNDLQGIQLFRFPFPIKGAQLTHAAMGSTKIIIWNEDNVSLMEWETGAICNISVLEGFGRIHGIIETDGEIFLRSDGKIAAIDLVHLRILDTELYQNTNLDGVIEELWLQTWDSTRKVLVCVRSLLNGEIEICSNNEDRKVFDVGTQVNITSFTYPWIITNDSFTMKILNVQDGRQCTVYESNSLIASLEHDDKNAGLVFILHEDGLSLNRLQIDNISGTLIDSSNTQEIDWDEYRWPVSFPTGARAVLNHNASKILQISDTGQITVRNCQRQVPGSIITLGIIDDCKTHLCIFSSDDESCTLWCNVMKIRNAQLEHVTEVAVAENLHVTGTARQLTNKNGQIQGQGQFYTVLTSQGCAHVYRVHLDIATALWKVSLWRTINPGNNNKENSFFANQDYVIQTPRNTNVNRTAMTVYSTVPSSAHQSFSQRREI